MSSKKISLDPAIFSALRDNNPFERSPVVRAPNIWNEAFLDIPSLNAEASNAVLEVLKQVQASDSGKVASIVFTAERGIGKSHIISRLRKRAQADNETIFIYAGADKYGDLDYINSLFQQSVAESMDRPNADGITQWQELAAEMVLEVLREKDKNFKAASTKDLVEKFDSQYYDNKAKGKDLVADLTLSIRKLKRNSNPSIEADPYIVKAILWTLSEEHSSFAVKWLAGEQLETQDAAELRLPLQDRDKSEKEALATTAVSKLLSLLSEYKTILICFDELDTVAVTSSDGLTTEIVILDLVKRLFDLIDQLSSQAKGVVILTAILNHRWNYIENTNVSSYKIASSGVMNLEYLKADTTRELVAINLNKFYSKKGLTPPTPIYPFEEEELSAFGEDRPLPREAIAWLASRLNEKIKEYAPPLPSISSKERMERAYQNAISQFDDDVLDENDTIASAIEFCFKKIIEIDKIRDQPIEGVIIKSVEEITPKRENGGWLNCKIVGEENGQLIVIGIGVLQQTNGLSVGAGFRRLLDTETFSLSRGCLIRSKERKLKRNWDSYEYYQQLVSKGGEWVNLTAEDIKPLLALQYVYNHHKKFDLSIKRLNSFAFTRSLLQQSPLIREILSRPEGAVDEDAAEGQKAQHWHEDVDANDLQNELNKDLANESVSDETEMQSDLQGFAEALSA